jgi:hypothetical protein
MYNNAWVLLRQSPMRSGRACLMSVPSELRHGHVCPTASLIYLTLSHLNIHVIRTPPFSLMHTSRNCVDLDIFVLSVYRLDWSIAPRPSISVKVSVSGLMRTLDFVILKLCAHDITFQTAPSTRSTRPHTHSRWFVDSLETLSNTSHPVYIVDLPLIQPGHYAILHQHAIPDAAVNLFQHAVLDRRSQPISLPIPFSTTLICWDTTRPRARACIESCPSTARIALQVDSQG